jgi:hypothetical protein
VSRFYNEKKKILKKKFFLEKDFEKDYDLPFGHFKAAPRCDQV